VGVFPTAPNILFKIIAFLKLLVHYKGSEAR